MSGTRTRTRTARKRGQSSINPTPSKRPRSPVPSSPPLTASHLAPLLASLSSALAAALRFASAEADLLLLPSQSLLLDPLLLSSARSLSRLLSLLPLHLQTLTLTSLSLSPPLPPSLPSSWFLRFLSTPSSSWHNAFHMSRATFFRLLDTLSFAPSYSLLSLPPDHKLGAALFRLAHCAPFRAVARRFGLPSPAVAARAFYEVCRAIADRLGDLLDFDVPDRLARAVPGFCALSLPNCCGVVGYARFGGEEEGEGEGREEERVVAQALVDADGRFLDVSVGWHGSMAPAEIIGRTKLYTTQSAVLAYAPRAKLISGSVPRYFLGGSCCPLLPWLLTPFKDVGGSCQGDPSKESVFNEAHVHAMEVVNKAFRHVRARWRLLGMPWKRECREALPYVVVASCLLHNFLIKCGEPTPEEAEEGVDIEGFPEFEGRGDEEGERIREVLAMHLSILSQNK